MKTVYIYLFAPFLLTAFCMENASAFDHDHTVWNEILKDHVKWVQNGTASRVNYSGIRKEHGKLKNYLKTLSDVDRTTFEGWSRNRRLAFLINAYNAFTVELILTKYPKIKSIKDLGSLFKSPWKKKFFFLFGKKMHLDDIEHGMIRIKGAYDDPRTHFALVCASIGCPGIRNEAFVEEKLDTQLEDSMIRFLSDKTRNRFNKKTGTLEVSKIFDWYSEDFQKGFHGFDSVATVFKKYAKYLADSPESIRAIKAGVEIVFLDYDWHLNDLK